MSVAALTWAKAQAAPTITAKSVLICMADYADEHGVAWPAVKTLAREVQASDRTIQRALRALEENGLVTVERRDRQDGGQTSNGYKLAMPPGDNLSPAPRQNVTPPVTQVSPPYEQPLELQPSDEGCNSEPIGSGAEAAPPSPVAPDHDKLAWSEAVRIITAAGVSERSARSFFGKLLSANGLIARDLLPSLTAASVNATGDPQSYLTKAAAAVAKRRGCMEGPAAPNPSAWGDDEWRAAVEIWGESGAWSDALGPPPDQPGTRVPPSLRPRPMKAE